MKCKNCVFFSDNVFKVPWCFKDDKVVEETDGCKEGIKDETD